MTDGGREDREAATKGEGKESVRSRLHGLPTPVVRYFRRFVRFLPLAVHLTLTSVPYRPTGPRRAASGLRREGTEGRVSGRSLTSFVLSAARSPLISSRRRLGSLRSCSPPSFVTSCLTPPGFALRHVRRECDTERRKGEGME